MPGTWINGLTEESHLANAYTGYSDAEKEADRKAAEQAVMDISEDQTLLDEMEQWAYDEEEVNFKPFYHEENTHRKQDLKRASRSMGRPKKRREMSGLDFHFLSEVGLQLQDPTSCGEVMLHKYERDEQEIKQQERIQKAQLETQLKPEPKPEPVKLEPCETFEELKRWMEIAHSEYIDDEMMTRIEEKCRKIEKEF